MLVILDALLAVLIFMDRIREDLAAIRSQIVLRVRDRFEGRYSASSDVPDRLAVAVFSLQHEAEHSRSQVSALRLLRIQLCLPARCVCVHKGRRRVGRITVIDLYIQFSVLKIRDDDRDRLRMLVIVNAVLAVQFFMDRIREDLAVIRTQVRLCVFDRTEGRCSACSDIANRLVDIVPAQHEAEHSRPQVAALCLPRVQLRRSRRRVRVREHRCRERLRSVIRYIQVAFAVVLYQDRHRMRMLVILHALLVVFNFSDCVGIDLAGIGSQVVFRIRQCTERPRSASLHIRYCLNIACVIDQLECECPVAQVTAVRLLRIQLRTAFRRICVRDYQRLFFPIICNCTYITTLAVFTNTYNYLIASWIVRNTLYRITVSLSCI